MEVIGGVVVGFIWHYAVRQAIHHGVHLSRHPLDHDVEFTP